MSLRLPGAPPSPSWQRCSTGDEEFSRRWAGRSCDKDHTVPPAIAKASYKSRSATRPSPSTSRSRGAGTHSQSTVVGAKSPARPWRLSAASPSLVGRPSPPRRRNNRLETVTSPAGTTQSGSTTERWPPRSALNGHDACAPPTARSVNFEDVAHAGAECGPPDRRIQRDHL